MVKQVQQHRPNVPTNPDRSCTYLVLKAHSDELSIQLKQNLEFPQGGAAQYSSLNQRSEEHWPMTSSRDQRRNRPSPGKTRSASESRFTRHFDNGKTRPAKPPDAPTNLDRSCTYLVLRAHSDEHYVQLKPTLKFPRGGAASGSVWTITQRSTGPGV